MEENKYRKETRYWCEYCRMFVYNNKISRQTHEQNPKHKNAIERYLRTQYKQKDQRLKEEKIWNELDKKLGVPTVSKPVQVKEKRRINVNDYGYSVPLVEKAEFKVTEEFALLNRQTIHTTQIGEWEVVEDQVDDANHESGVDPIEKIEHVPLIQVQVNEQIDPKMEEEQFELKEKKVERGDADDDEPVVFKKRKLNTKSFRKK